VIGPEIIFGTLYERIGYGDYFGEPAPLISEQTSPPKGFGFLLKY